MEWKNLCLVQLIICLFLCVGEISYAQNLVPNPSFEEYEDCPDGGGQIDRAKSWFNVGGGCDYYHECGENGYGIPISVGGGGYARTGSAYTQVSTFAKNIINGRELIGTELIQPLSSGVIYRVQFFVSLFDSVHYAVKNLGAHFSIKPHPQSLATILTLTPQVGYEEAEFLANKDDWVKISGRFTAQGGERYLAIGNFDNDLSTDTLFVDDGGSYAIRPVGFWDISAYFIDDVSVVPDSVHLSTEDVEFQEEELVVYPNPAKDELTIDFSIQPPYGRSLEVTLVDLSGREVQTLGSTQGNSQARIDVSGLPRGVYVAVLSQEGVVVARRKVVLQ